MRFFYVIHGEIQVEISDLKKVVSINFRKQTFKLASKVNTSKLAGSLSGEELLFFLKMPLGVVTLYITSCFYANNPLLWFRLLYYRHGLYMFHGNRFKRTFRQWLGWVKRLFTNRLKVVFN